MFAKGTKIMYGNTGVCEVMDYATPDLPGMPRGTKYYVLRPLFQSGTIYCPVEQPKVFMRPVMSREEAEELVALTFLPSAWSHSIPAVCRSFQSITAASSALTAPPTSWRSSNRFTAKSGKPKPPAAASARWTTAI